METKVPTIDMAYLLGVNEKTLRRYAAAGCPHKRTRAGLMFDPKLVRAWMDWNNRTGKPGRPSTDGPWSDDDLAEVDGMFRESLGESLEQAARSAAAV
jgi:hypothetical protein